MKGRLAIGNQLLNSSKDWYPYICLTPLVILGHFELQQSRTKQKFNNLASITTLTGEHFSQILFGPLLNDYPLPGHLDLPTIVQIQGPHPWFLRLSSARVSSPGK